MLLSHSAKPLLSCVVVLLLGYATGLQLGRIAPYALRLNDEFGFGLSTIGWLTSLVTLFVALFAVPASRAIPAFGLVRAIKVGAVVMTAGAVTFCFVDTLPLMITARIIEAAGHIITVIAAPSYLATKAPENLKRVFLALWSSFLPVGFALSNILGGFLAGSTDLKTIWLIYAVILVVVSVVVLLVLTDAPPSKRSQSDAFGTSKIAWILVYAFGTYAFLSIGFFTFMPTFVLGLELQILSAGIVPLFVPMGSFVAAFLFARADAVLPTKIVGIGFLAIFLAAIFCFPSGQVDGSIMRAVYAFACGITAASIFTAVPVVTRTTEEATMTIGAIAQAGGLMVLIGAPLAGFIVETVGWQSFGYSLAVAAFSAFLVATLVLRRRGHES